MLDSAITLITGDSLFYRGRDAVRMAREARLEVVAGLIWDAEGDGADDPFEASAPAEPPAVAAARPALAGLRPIERCQALLPVIAAADEAAFNVTPAGRRATGARILRWMAALAADTIAGPAAGSTGCSATAGAFRKRRRSRCARPWCCRRIMS